MGQGAVLSFCFAFIFMMLLLAGFGWFEEPGVITGNVILDEPDESSGFAKEGYEGFEREPTKEELRGEVFLPLEGSIFESEGLDPLGGSEDGTLDVEFDDEARERYLAHRILEEGQRRDDVLQEPETVGFFEGIGQWFGRLFGSNEEENTLREEDVLCPHMQGLYFETEISGVSWGTERSFSEAMNFAQQECGREQNSLIARANYFSGVEEEVCEDAWTTGRTDITCSFGKDNWQITGDTCEIILCEEETATTYCEYPVVDGEVLTEQGTCVDWQGPVDEEQWSITCKTKEDMKITQNYYCDERYA